MKLQKVDSNLKVLVSGVGERAPEQIPVLVSFAAPVSDHVRQQLKARGLKLTSVLGRRATASLSAQQIGALTDLESVVAVSAAQVTKPL